ncbi:MAG: hypothetical protein GY851_28865 [bacterium]|nr:hypothetical protein [bacterium]
MMNVGTVLGILGVMIGAVGAPSLDTSQTWVETPDGKPVIDRGAAGEWDASAVDNPFLFSEDGTLYCFYEGQDKPFKQGGHERIGLAMSRDGLRWVKSKSNPVLDVGPEGAWDGVVSKLPVVTRLGSRYHMFYSGRDARTKQIGLATSTNLVDWTRHPTNPVIPSRPDSWDAFISTYPAPPMLVDGRWHFLYRGMAGYYRQQGAGLAVSDDLVTWKRASDDPLTPLAEEVASLAVAQTAERYVGLAQAPSRSYWVSDDLASWRKEGPIRLTGEKVDTLSNPVWFGGEWIVVYEKQDRIHRAVLGGEGK